MKEIRYKLEMIDKRHRQGTNKIKSRSTHPPKFSHGRARQASLSRPPDKRHEADGVWQCTDDFDGGTHLRREGINYVASIIVSSSMQVLRMELRK